MILNFVGPALVASLIDNGFDVADDDFGLIHFIIFIPILLGLYFGLWQIVQGRRMSFMPATVLLAEGERPPVLYLRSFDDDDLIDPMPPMVPLGDLFEAFVSYDAHLIHA